MDKYEVAKTIGEEFNYPWIEEMNCFNGFPEVLKNEDGTDVEGCDWYMGEGKNDFGTFIDIEVDMTPELREAAQHWCGEMRFDEDEFGNYLQVDYDTADIMYEICNNPDPLEEMELTQERFEEILSHQDMYSGRIVKDVGWSYDPMGPEPSDEELDKFDEWWFENAVCDHIQILLKSQTHLKQLAEGIKAYNKEFPSLSK
jgi:hypothetical protein